MKNGYKLEDKCLRNELLILINYLMGDDKGKFPLFYPSPLLFQRKKFFTGHPIAGDLYRYFTRLRDRR